MSRWISEACNTFSKGPHPQKDCDDGCACPCHQKKVCSAVEDIGEHIRGSFIIEPGTLRIVGHTCLFCGDAMAAEERGEGEG